MNSTPTLKSKLVQEKGPLIITSLEKILQELFSEKLGKIYFQDLSGNVCKWKTTFLNSRTLSIRYNILTNEVLLYVRRKNNFPAATRTWSACTRLDEYFADTLRYFLQGKI